MRELLGYNSVMESENWDFHTAKFNKAVASLLLENEYTSAFVLMTILMDALSDEILFESEPEVIFMEVKDRFNVELPEENKNKIQAALISMTTDLFYTNFDVFKAITLALNEGDIGDMVYGEDEEINASEILWAIVEVAMLNGTTFSETEFPEYMEKHINTVVDEEAEDNEELDPETDTIEEAFQETYYQRYVTVKLLDVARDLLKLEVPSELVQELLQSHNRSLQELKD